MIDTRYTKKLLFGAKAADALRRDLQPLASQILSESKRAIFSMHRSDMRSAEKHLASAAALLKRGRGLVKKSAKLSQEGFWRAAQEEYAEAELVRQYLESGRMGSVALIEDPDVYLAALSDATGELVRLATMLAADGAVDEIFQIHEDVEEAMGVLLQADATGSLRTKIDQARNNLRKLEDMRYELSLRSA